MMSGKNVFISMNTSSVRNNFSEVIDTVIGKDRVIFERYGKRKAALVTTDDADVIKYLLDDNSYEEILDLAKKVRKEKEENKKKINTG